MPWPCLETLHCNACLTDVDGIPFHTLDLPDKGRCRMTDLQQALRKAAMATVQFNLRADCFQPFAEFLSQTVEL